MPSCRFQSGETELTVGFLSAEFPWWLFPNRLMGCVDPGAPLQGSEAERRMVYRAAHLVLKQVPMQILRPTTCPVRNLDEPL